jgi:L-amino acid N-acyltransferase YncA
MPRASYVGVGAEGGDLEGLGADEWSRRLESAAEAGLPFLVTELDGRVAGYAYVTPWKPKPAYRHTVENSIYLAPWAVGRGLGGPLLDALLAACEAAGVSQVIAIIADTGDPGSFALHGSRGFHEAGRLRNVGLKHGRWLDTVLFQRALGPDAVADAAGEPAERYGAIS